METLILQSVTGGVGHLDLMHMLAHGITDRLESSASDHCKQRRAIGTSVYVLYSRDRNPEYICGHRTLDIQLGKLRA
jgi:hypothetical protein